MCGFKLYGQNFVFTKCINTVNNKDICYCLGYTKFISQDVEKILLDKNGEIPAELFYEYLDVNETNKELKEMVQNLFIPTK